MNKNSNKTSLDRLLEIERDIQANLSRGSIDAVESHRAEREKLYNEILENEKTVKLLHKDLKVCFEIAKEIAIRLKRHEGHSFDGLFSNSSDGWELQIQSKAEYLCERLSLDVEKEYTAYLESTLEDRHDK